MPYDRDVVVQCVKRHYELLIRAAYLDPNALESPPSEGWNDDQLIVDALRALGRSEKVIDLLRHLPYIKPHFDMIRYEVWEETFSINYLREHTRGDDMLTVDNCRRVGRQLGDVLLMPDDADWPPSFVSLTQGSEATWWVIDTDDGIVFPTGIHTVNMDAPQEQPWRRLAHPRDIQEYFDEVHYFMISLKQVLVPIGPRHYSQVLPCELPNAGLVMKLLEKHGWPNGFNKDDYNRELEQLPPASLW
ncbi:hypothetical protein BKA63DRAFT_2294 [Paraphoma chrysanthemicola]|nr:hypothetical protein BKA63DRAFT_2294 [Paraphoma chrysanthemicola]